MTRMIDLTNDVNVRFVQANAAVVAEIDGQMVALDAASGICFGLNRVATRIWTLVGSGADSVGICAALVREFDVDEETCIAETLHVLADMQQAGLITAVDRAAASS